MKIKALWGFRGDAKKLGKGDGRVRAGDTFDNADPEYGHALVGKGLVEELDGGKASQRAAADMTPAQLKKALAEKNIAIPEGATKEQLAALLDGAGAQ
ncbi:hypothetical protein [Achromobacter piechaudii]|uniref:HeH/LEM domain-containing protein n=1 Tax=Achromobacter piechaudii TaxID=72556 RepID=A0A6S7DM56_9BURK|nr:hypothetical protein [Achromobacter piechaudii]CAB3889834.1 hypothetical protein LMG1861_03742 [Achromobacter piechaudii]